MGEKSSQILSTVGVKVLSNAVTVHCGTERKLLLLFGLGCGHANPAHMGAGACLKKERGDSYGNARGLLLVYIKPVL